MEDPIIKAVATAFRVAYEDIDDNSTAETVKGWDSLGLLQLAQLLEDSFEIDFDPDDYAEMVSVVAIRKLVARLTA